MTDIIEAWAWYNGYKQIPPSVGWWWDKDNYWLSTRQLIEKCKEQMMNL